MTPVLLTLAAIFVELSLLAFGGGNTVLPEMQRRVVEVHGWMTAQEFAAMYALAQAAPGPNMMVVTLIGWRVAGLPGVVVVMLAEFVPSSIVTGIALRMWDRLRDRPWRRVVQAGLAPMTVGLVAASAALITASSVEHWALGGVTAACTLVLLRGPVHPLWLLAAGALFGLTGIGQP